MSGAVRRRLPSASTPSASALATSNPSILLPPCGNGGPERTAPSVDSEDRSGIPLRTMTKATDQLGR